MTIADRLKPYKVAHELVYRLKPYEVTDLGLMFRGATWATLVYWAQLLETVQIDASNFAPGTLERVGPGRFDLDYD